MESCIERLYAGLLDDATVLIKKSDSLRSVSNVEDQLNEKREDVSWELVLRNGNIVNTMKGFCGVVLRIQVGEESVIVKLASTNGKMRPLLKNQYRNEVEFCRWLMMKKKVDGLPKIFASGYLNEEEQLFYIVMEDCGIGEMDQLSDCSIEDASNILRHWQRVQLEIGSNLSDLNVRSLFYSFINGVLFFEFNSLLEKEENLDKYLVETVCAKVEGDWTIFLDVIKELDWSTYSDTILQHFHTRIELPNLVANIKNSLSYLQNDQAFAVHGDFRLENIIKKGNSVKFIDFQSLSKGPCSYDLSHFTAQSISIQKRRTVEESLLREYFESLSGNKLSWESFLESYKHCIVLQMCYCVLGIGSHWKYYLQSGKLKDPQFLKEKSARVGMDIIARTCHLYIDHFQ
ncbi:aminoglycoside phosphotransferase [Naegleria gruberi]|uniref:Aminoglycoside phosphotransferase n=1 Tax=Naegleria gruberi TaxID=5762 RepID=D2V8G4_NAEGR|nr:aminoglycoside phosphotransferase [Naegleria gruberi]EFC46804.1 aminoglycoside phosphotransferase [Naegleria gruberi]|eukprot:XP_002679548.1 aminoglycoside phosphotransferase [Naegleria gruberi strain NEG-M]